MRSTPISQQRQPAYRRHLLRLIGVVLFAVILSQVDLVAVYGFLSQISAAEILQATLLCMIILAARAVRWWRLLRSFGVPSPFAQAALVSNDAILWGTLTPGRLGEFKRSVHLVQQHGLGVARSVAIGVIDRLFDLVALACFLVLTLAMIRSDAHLVSMGPAAALLAIIVAGLVLRRPITSGLMRVASRFRRITGLVSEVSRDMRDMPLATILLGILLSLVVLACYIGMVYVLSGPLDLRLSAADVAFSVVVTMAGGILPITFFNLGTREIILIALFQLYGHSATEAIAYSMVFMICYLILIATSFAAASLQKACMPKSAGRGRASNGQLSGGSSE